ncbi:zinc-binding alcohol dehydrogenase family protein [Methylobacterium sp. NEAU 140]|uniref:quinone oxidoreductase family protein n=1 Tax=Methylobacterium sp. NEAU 140 TaxID=3064945 RepID=UPI0027333FF3|nr:zinc-binding alcohol dehydrogenase family protein [Methylobacterium sp. NEAU 140]MDP4025660.1 zinc-binding alcohol dehydrogenase family protein [Methylobacterium sp. NEAU 140]
MSGTMQAVRFHVTGSLDAVRVEAVPRPEPGPGAVRVAVRAAGLNPSDAKNVLGRFPYTTVPRVPGRDFAGVVTDGPDDLVGRRVWGTGRDLGFDRDGSHAEWLTVPADGVALLPDRLAFAQAASLGVPYTTAWDGLERTGVGAGTRLLVVGAGAVGRAAADLARARGAAVHVAVRRPDQARALEAAGFEAGIYPDGTALPTGFAVAFETTGYRLPEAIRSLAPFGRVAVIAAPPGGTVETPVLDLYRRGGSLVGVNSLLYDSRACARMLARIGALFEAGDLVPGAVTEVPLAEAAAAYRAVAREGGDKVVLAMPGTV